MNKLNFIKASRTTRNNTFNKLFHDNYFVRLGYVSVVALIPKAHLGTHSSPW